MIKEIILASKSGVRKKILDENKINSQVIPANIDEEAIKESLLKEKATPEMQYLSFLSLYQAFSPNISSILQ